MLPVNIVFDPAPPAHRRWVPARRGLARPDELACYLAYAPDGTTADELVRVAGSRRAIGACFQAAKSECGLDQYESAATSADTATSPWPYSRTPTSPP